MEYQNYSERKKKQMSFLKLNQSSWTQVPRLSQITAYLK